MRAFRSLIGIALLLAACAGPATDDEALAPAPYRLVLAGEFRVPDTGYTRLCWSADGATLGVQGSGFTAFWRIGDHEPRILNRAMDLGPGFGGDSFLVRDQDGLAVLRGRDLEIVRRIPALPPGGSRGILRPSPDGSRVFAAGGIVPLHLRGSYLADSNGGTPLRFDSFSYLNWTWAEWLPHSVGGLIVGGVGGQHGEMGELIALDQEGVTRAEIGPREIPGPPQVLSLSPSGRTLICLMASSWTRSLPQLLRIDPVTLKTLPGPTRSGRLMWADLGAFVHLDEDTLLAAPRQQGRLALWDAASLSKIDELDISTGDELALDAARRKLALSRGSLIYLYQVVHSL